MPYKPYVYFSIQPTERYCALFDFYLPALRLVKVVTFFRISIARIWIVDPFTELSTDSISVPLIIFNVNVAVLVGTIKMSQSHTSIN